VTLLIGKKNCRHGGQACSFYNYRIPKNEQIILKITKPIKILVVLTFLPNNQYMNPNAHAGKKQGIIQSMYSWIGVIAPSTPTSKGIEIEIIEAIIDPTTNRPKIDTT